MHTQAVLLGVYTEVELVHPREAAYLSLIDLFSSVAVPSGTQRQRVGAGASFPSSVKGTGPILAQWGTRRGRKPRKQEHFKNFLL